jgi:GNAT superfamily N-acetyltransferase
MARELEDAMEFLTSNPDTGHRIEPELPGDAEAVEKLLSDAFGPGRFAKTAERLREGRQPSLDLSFVARRGDNLLGCVRLWTVEVGGAVAILLGPFAVDVTVRGLGIGRALIDTACDAARRAGHGVAVLGRRVVMPGPVDQARVLVRALSPKIEIGPSGAVAPSIP